MLRAQSQFPSLVPLRGQRTRPSANRSRSVWLQARRARSVAGAASAVRVARAIAISVAGSTARTADSAVGEPVALGVAANSVGCTVAGVAVAAGISCVRVARAIAISVAGSTARTEDSAVGESITIGVAASSVGWTVAGAALVAAANSAIRFACAIAVFIAGSKTRAMPSVVGEPVAVGVAASSVGWTVASVAVAAGISCVRVARAIAISVALSTARTEYSAVGESITIGVVASSVGWSVASVAVAAGISCVRVARAIAISVALSTARTADSAVGDTVTIGVVASSVGWSVASVAVAAGISCVRVARAIAISVARSTARTADSAVGESVALGVAVRSVGSTVVGATNVAGNSAVRVGRAIVMVVARSTDRTVTSAVGDTVALAVAAGSVGSTVAGAASPVRVARAIAISVAGSTTRTADSAVGESITIGVAVSSVGWTVALATSAFRVGRAIVVVVARSYCLRGDVSSRRSSRARRHCKLGGLDGCRRESRRREFCRPCLSRNRCVRRSRNCSGGRPGRRRYLSRSALLASSVGWSVAAGTSAVRISRVSVVCVALSTARAVNSAVGEPVAKVLTAALVSVAEDGKGVAEVAVVGSVALVSTVITASLVGSSPTDVTVAAISVAGCSVGLGGSGGFCVAVDNSSANSPANSSESAAVSATTSSLPLLRRIG